MILMKNKGEIIRTIPETLLYLELFTVLQRRRGNRHIYGVNYHISPSKHMLLPLHFIEGSQHVFMVRKETKNCLRLS